MCNFYLTISTENKLYYTIIICICTTFFDSCSCVMTHLIEVQQPSFLWNVNWTWRTNNLICLFMLSNCHSADSVVTSKLYPSVCFSTVCSSAVKWPSGVGCIWIYLMCTLTMCCRLWHRQITNTEAPIKHVAQTLQKNHLQNLDTSVWIPHIVNQFCVAVIFIGYVLHKRICIARCLPCFLSFIHNCPLPRWRCAYPTQSNCWAMYETGKEISGKVRYCQSDITS